MSGAYISPIKLYHKWNEGCSKGTDSDWNNLYFKIYSAYKYFVYDKNIQKCVLYATAYYYFKE